VSNPATKFEHLILSSVLFCIYINGLLVRLKQSKIGCWIGNTFVGAIAYADDITLLAPTPSAMRYMLRSFVLVLMLPNLLLCTVVKKTC